MIRSSAIVLPILLAGIFFASSAWPRGTSHVMATATANVVEDLSITSEDPLSFGFITPSPQGGTVKISPENIRSATGGIHATSEFTRATFAVRGMSGHSYTIHTPDSLIFSVKRRKETEESRHLVSELTVKDFVTYSTTAGTTATTGKLGRDGRDKIYLGATLIVPKDAAPGVYSGWVPLTVSY